jgi:signal transduction histidine kinase
MRQPPTLLPYKTTIDSLKALIENGKRDTTQSINMCLLSNLYAMLKNDSALIYSGMALSVANELKNPYCRVMALNYLGVFFYNINNYDSANAYWQKGLNICIANNFYYEELKNFRVTLNNNFFLRGNYAAAMKMSIDGLARAEKINDREIMAHFNNVLGYILMRQQNFEESRNYYQTNLNLAREINNKVLEGNALLSLADLALAEKKLTSAAGFIHKALNIFKANELTYHPFEREAYSYNKLAEVNKLMQKKLEALDYCRLAISTSQKGKCNKYDISSYYINAGDIYNRLQIPDSAILFLRTGLHIARNIIHREYMRDAFKQLSIAFAQKKLFDSAYTYQQSFLTLQDSIAVESSHREILQLETNFKMEQQKQLQREALERQKFLRNIIIGIAVFLIAFILLLYNHSRLKQQNKFQAELNMQQQEILRTTINVQDRERKRIAEDLHDSLGSILSAAKLKLSAVEEDSMADSAEKKKMKDTLLLLDEALSEMKNIAYNIMPATLSRLGLTVALQNLFNRIGTRSGLKINYITHGFIERLDETTELSIYRIVLESTNNVIKHAAAKNVTVQLLKYPDYINITIEDNGIGFDLNEKNFSGNGLGNIVSRVKSLKGTIDIDSKRASGTTFLIDIPYKNTLD